MVVTADNTGTKRLVYSVISVRQNTTIGSSDWKEINLFCAVHAHCLHVLLVRIYIVGLYA